MPDEKKEFPLFAPGRYKAMVVKNEPSKTAAGDPQYEIRFRLEEGPDKGKFITWYGYFGSSISEKQKTFRFGSMRTAGWDGERASLAKSWGEREVIIEIVTTTMKANEKYPEERKRSEVQYINAVDGSRPGAPALAPAERESVADALFGSYQAPAKDAPEDAFKADPKEDLPF